MLEMAKGKLLSLIYLENQLVFTPVTRMRYSRQGNGRKSMFVKKNPPDICFTECYYMGHGTL